VISRYLRPVPGFCIALLLLFTFRLYTFAYFWLDDFNNLYWVQQQTFGEALGYILTPSAQHFRPVGMMVYWIALRVFDRAALPYHLLMWAFHALNVTLVFIVLRRFTQSRAGAYVGAMLYAYPAAFSDVFWSFGTIFELVGAMLFFIGLLVWQRKERTVWVVLLAFVVFFLALKSKEMAITLPAIWLLQDLFLRRPLRWKELSAIVFPGLLGFWYGLQRLLEMRNPDPAGPYYMDVQGIVMGRGFGYYFNALFSTEIRWEQWSVGFAALLLLFLLLRWRLAAFFQIYVFVTFLPLIFLNNHRDPFYWYFPMLGVCGLAALLARAIASWLAAKVDESRLAPYGVLAFAVLCAGMYLSSRDATLQRRLWQHGIARDYRGFVERVQSLPSPKPGETLLFDSMPRYFDIYVLKYASQVALRRTDIDAKLMGGK
jgi:hypothetical protein